MSTFVDEVIRSAEEVPDKVCLISGEERQLRYRDLLYASGSVQALLGDVKGKRVLIAAKRKEDFLKSFLAVMGAGGAVVPLDNFSLDGATFLIQDAEISTVLFASDTLSKELVDGLQSGNPELNLIELDRAGNGTEDSPLQSHADPDSPGLFLYTSGTSGRRKGVVLSNRAFLAPAKNVNPAMGYTGEEVEYICGDFTHAFAIGRMRCLLPVGATAVVDDGPFIANQVINSVKRFQCDAISSPASSFIILERMHREAFRDLAGQIRVIKMASQGVPVEIKRCLMEDFPDTLIFQNYGLSESQRVTLLEFHRDEKYLESSGRPLAGNEVRILDEDGNEVPTGTVGRISVASGALMTCYWKREDLTKDRLRNGWIVTDDLGQLNEEGFLTFCGRADEVLNIGGLKVSPLEIEELVSGYLPDHEFCVCGIDDPGGMLGQVPALVVKEGEEPLERWKGWPAIRLKLAKTKPTIPIPKFAFKTGEIPKTANGKVKRKALQEMIAEFTANRDS